MAQLVRMLQWQVTSGEQITVGDVTLTPQSQGIIAYCKGKGLVWNSPVAILVECGGHREHIPVMDVTRAVQLGIIGLGIIVIVLALCLRRERSHHGR